MGETDDFEWDDGKDAVNRAKHGLPLAFGIFIFDGRPRFERPSPKIMAGEPRLEAVAELEAVLYYAYSHGEDADGV